MAKGTPQRNGKLRVPELCRVPPHDLDAERAVIGATLASDRAVEVVTERLRPEDFYSETHRVIFDAVRRLHGRSEKVDQITLASELRVDDEYDRIGGRAYIFQIVESVPTAANAARYAEMVRNAAILRGVIEVGARIQDEGFREQDDPSMILDRVEQLVYELNRDENNGRGGFAEANALAMGSLERVQERYENQGDPAGISTGFDGLDRVMLGMEPEEIIVIGGRTSMGKTAAALSIVKSVCVDRKLPVAIFSLEMSKDQLSDRLVSMSSGVPSRDLKTGRVRADDWPKLTSGAGAVANAPLFIDDTAGISLAQMRPRLRRLSSKLAAKGTPLAAVMVDYVQLMTDPAAKENRQQEISAISRGLKQMAREFTVPILTLSQMNRDTEKKGNKRPVISELRDSGSLEQDADKILLLYRDEYYNPDSEDKGIAEVNVAKHRNGPTGTVKLAWVEKQARFAPLAFGLPG